MFYRDEDSDDTYRITCNRRSHCTWTDTGATTYREAHMRQRLHDTSHEWGWRGWILRHLLWTTLWN